MSEFTEDERYLAWERFSDAANKEKEWMHQRLNWLFTIQGFLFTAFVATLVGIIKYSTGTTGPEVTHTLEWLSTLTHILPFIGLSHSLAGLLGTFAAARMHWKWTSVINDIVDAIGDDGKLSFGSRPHWPARTSSILPPLVATGFVFLWSYILINKYGGVYCSRSTCITIALICASILICLIVKMRKKMSRYTWSKATKYEWPDW